MSEQPRVEPEAPSWCISSVSADAWRDRGLVLQKAHRVAVKERHFGPVHLPVCGAQVRHYEQHCTEAPPGWPACRHCQRKPAEALPSAFASLLSSEGSTG